MKFGFSTLGCPDWEWTDIFSAAKDLGYDGIEVRGVSSEMYAPNMKMFSEENLPDTLSSLARADLSIPMLTSAACLGDGSDPQKAYKEACDYINLAAKLGTLYIRVMISSKPDPQPTDDVAAAGELYKKICEYGKKRGVCPLLETSGSFADSKVMKALFEEGGCENGGVLWDVHHPYRFFNESVEEVYRDIGKYIRYTHFKDSKMEDGKVKYQMMGYGDVPYLDAMKLLSENGYDGFITLEWVKRWNSELSEPGIVFAHYINYMKHLLRQIEK